MKAQGLQKLAAALGLLALALLAGWPLLSAGYPQGHDWIYELARAAEYPIARLGEVPERFRSAFLEVGEESFHIAPALRRTATMRPCHAR